MLGIFMFGIVVNFLSAKIKIKSYLKSIFNWNLLIILFLLTFIDSVFFTLIGLSKKQSNL